MSIICIDSETEALTECPTATQSRVIINWIDHDTANTIDITIAEELSRDYTWTWETMQIFVTWYNVDNEYISQVIQQTKLAPTADDFSYLLSWLWNYIPLIAISWLMIRARRIIKKVF